MYRTIVVFLVGAVGTGFAVSGSLTLPLVSAVSWLFFALVPLVCGALHHERELALRDGLAYGLGSWVGTVAMLFIHFSGLLVMSTPFMYQMLIPALFNIMPAIFFAWIGYLIRRRFFATVYGPGGEGDLLTVQ